MNKKELEKMFDEKFGKLYSEQHLENGKLGIGISSYPRNEEVKGFIFNYMFTEMLHWLWITSQNWVIWRLLKSKLKKFYWIIL